MLVNNAGIAGAAPIDQYSLADWEKIVAVNLTETNVPTWISTPNPDRSAAVRR